MDQDSQESPRLKRAGLHRNGKLEGGTGSSWDEEVGGRVRNVGGATGTE